MDLQNDYQFVMIPQQLSSCLDANCEKMLTTLIGLNSMLSKDGWFYRSNTDLQGDTRLGETLVRATLDTLYQAGIIDIDCVGKGRGHRSNRIHINFESFKKYQQYSFNDIRNNPDLWIETIKYKGSGFSTSYSKKSSQNTSQDISQNTSQKVRTNTNTIDTSYTSNIIYTKETINTKESIDTKDINKEDYYLLSFLDNPSKDYRCLLDNVSYFINRNNSDLLDLQENLNKKCNCNYTINDIIGSLQFLYKEKINYKINN